MLSIPFRLKRPGPDRQNHQNCQGTQQTSNKQKYFRQKHQIRPSPQKIMGACKLCSGSVFASFSKLQVYTVHDNGVSLVQKTARRSTIALTLVQKGIQFSEIARLWPRRVSVTLLLKMSWLRSQGNTFTID